MHIYIHTYLPTYLPTYLHTYIHTHIHTYIHACIHTYIHTYIYKCVCLSLLLTCYVCASFFFRNKSSYVKVWIFMAVIIDITFTWLCYSSFFCEDVWACNENQNGMISDRETPKRLLWVPWQSRRGIHIAPLVPSSFLG